MFFSEVYPDSEVCPVSEYGRKVGFPTPMNDRVVEIIHQIEQGKLQPSFDNLQYFK